MITLFFALLLAQETASVESTVVNALSGEPYYMDTDANGIIHFDHFAPGEYRILPWQKLEQRFLEIPEFRARFEGSAFSFLVSSACEFCMTYSSTASVNPSPSSGAST